GQYSDDLYFYCDGHVRVYHGEQTQLPRHYVARERLCLRATADYWVNAMDGQPFLYVNKEVDPGLIATLGNDVIPSLEKTAPKTAEIEQRLAEDPRAHWFTVVFDREGYSPEFFAQLFEKRIAILTYHKFPKQDWPVEEFTAHRVQLASGQAVTMKLAERGTRLYTTLWVRSSAPWPYPRVVLKTKCRSMSNAKDNCRNRFSIWTWRSRISNNSASKPRIMSPSNLYPKRNASRACAPSASTSSIPSK